MAVPKPTGLHARHAPGWAYLTVPAKRGHIAEVEYNDRGTWSPAAPSGKEWLVPVPQTLRTDFRARYERGGEHSAWTTGRVWTPKQPGDPGLEVDGDDPPTPPPPPHTLRSFWHASGTVELSWEQNEEVDHWHLIAYQDGSTVADLLPVQPSAVVSDLAYDRPVTVSVAAVVGQAESPPLERKYPDFNYQPAKPESLTVWPTDTGFDLSWSQPDLCEQWQVLWRPADAATGYSVETWPLGIKGDTGNVEVGPDPDYQITGLRPGTEYELLIVARWRRSTYGDALIEHHHTGGGEEGPRKPRLRAGRITDTSIAIEWDDDPAATGWVVRRKPGHSRHRPTGQPYWLADDLAPEMAYEFGVIAVDDDHGLESEEATIVLSTTGGTPVDPPSPPGNIRAHCIHPRHAKVEWDGNPPGEAVSHYMVAVAGGPERRVIGTLVELAELVPDTAYEVRVRACRDDGCSKAALVSFRTGSEEPPPDPDPPSGLPAPSGLYLDPVAPGRVRASWDRASESATWWLATGDDQTWHRVSGTPTVELDVGGSQGRVQVYALVDGKSGTPTKISAITAADVVTAKRGF